MTKLNPSNERIKRDYCRYLKGARGKSEATLDEARKALSRYEEYTRHRDFCSFCREQAIGFKEHLAETSRLKTGETLSHSTQVRTLAMLKEFFIWLAWQRGFKSKIHVPDIEYLNPAIKDATAAKSAKLRDFPSLEQIRAVIDAAPVATVMERRNRALLAFAILTGMRDRALVSVSLRDVDLSKKPPLVRQEPGRIETKFSKNIDTYFIPLGNDLTAIIVDWIEELQTRLLFAPTAPLFPRTKVRQGDNLSFEADGVEPIHWRNASPVRQIFRQAFERVGLNYFPPHSFRRTLGHLMQTVCPTPQQIKAWSQNLGHENVATTLTSYGKIDPHQQGDIIAAITLEASEPDDDVLAKIRALVA